MRVAERFLFWVLSVAGMVNAQALPSVAVAEFQLNGVDSSHGAAVMDALSAELKNTGRFRVMERSQMDRILLEQGFQQSGACDNTTCAIQVGQLLSLDAMVIGSLSKIENTVAVNARLVDMGSGEILVALNRSTVQGSSYLLQQVIPGLAQGLAQPEGPSGVSYVSSEKTTSQKESDVKPIWPWIVGGVAVTGAVIAAVLLAGADDGSGDGKPAATPDPETQLHFTW